MKKTVSIYTGYGFEKQAIDIIDVDADYTAADYITDCESNGIDTSSWYDEDGNINIVIEAKEN